MHLAEIHIFPVKACAGIPLPHAAAEPHGLAHDRRWMLTDPAGRFLSQRTLPALATLRATPTHHGLTLTTPAQPPLHIPTPPPHTPLTPVTIWRDTLPAADAGPLAAAWLTQALATPARLVHLPHPHARPIRGPHAHAEHGPEHVSFADGFPILLVSLTSLAALNAQLATPIPITRFRANLVIDGAPPWAEDSWRLIRIGTTTLRIAKPCDRCTVTTIDQTTGQRAPAGPDRLEPLRTLGRIRHDEAGIMFGQNLVPTAPNHLAPGHLATGHLAIGQPIEILQTGPPNVVPL